MTQDSSYRLKSDDDTSSGHFQPRVNPNDLQFFPSKELVFNAPFDFDNITYHMQLRNNSNHSIAFAIKGNSVPRIMAYPPSGIIKKEKTILVAVTVKKFEWNSFDYQKDRISFEYVVLKDELSDVKEFSHSLFQNSDLKMRKNIHIVYNL